MNLIVKALDSKIKAKFYQRALKWEEHLNQEEKFLRSHSAALKVKKSYTGVVTELADFIRQKYILDVKLGDNFRQNRPSILQ